jgi:hypothetical protein
LLAFLSSCLGVVNRELSQYELPLSVKFDLLFDALADCMTQRFRVYLRLFCFAIKQGSVSPLDVRVFAWAPSCELLCHTR